MFVLLLSSLLFVSTLDGKVSALDAAHEGKTVWSLDLGKEPMLSSNIHQREVNLKNITLDNFLFCF